MTPRGIHHLAIQVRDLALLERFYRDLLGLPELKRWPAPDGAHDRSVWLGLGDGASFLALECCTGERPRLREESAFFEPSAGLHLVALGIGAGERAAWETRLRAAGVEIVHHTPFTIYFFDPEGNRVGLSHYPDAAPAAEVAPTT